MMTRKIGRVINQLLGRAGLGLIRSVRDVPYLDLGREYCDPPGVLPHFRLMKAAPLPYAGYPTIFCVDNGASMLEEEVLYAHLTLLKLCKHYEFSTVLDIGSHQRRVTRILEHIGKKVTTVEVAPGYEADYKKDYLTIKFDEPFDAIWCSHVLEHQRNVGQFLDKLFDDLKEGGVLAITVPYDLSPSLACGHHNMYSPLMLIYQLVCAGFDCKTMSLKWYNGNIGALVRKRYNGINRHLPFGTLPNTPDKAEMISFQGRMLSVRDLLGEEVFDGLVDSFPVNVESNSLPFQASSHASINWGNPI